MKTSGRVSLLALLSLPPVPEKIDPIVDLRRALASTRSGPCVSFGHGGLRVEIPHDYPPEQTVRLLAEIRTVANDLATASGIAIPIDVERS